MKSHLESLVALALVWLSLNIPFTAALDETGLPENVQVFENPSDSYLKLVLIDPKTHKAVDETVSGESEVAKRGYNLPPILPILQKYKATSFCKGFCPNNVASTVVKTSTRTKYTTQTSKRTTTICPTGDCKKATITSTSTLDPPTVIKSITSIFPFTITSTIVLPTITSTSTTTFTDVSTITVTVTTDSTISAPSPTLNIRQVARSNCPPKPNWLKNYAEKDICKACKIYVPLKPKTSTTTKTVVKTITTALVRTETLPLGTTKTIIKFITPRPTTVITQIEVTSTVVISTTTTPIETITTEVTTKTTTTTTSTVTNRICPSLISETWGAGVTLTGGGHTVVSSASTVLDCCAACYNQSGCVAWWLPGIPTGCRMFVDMAPHTAPIDSTCPAGRGDVSFLLVPFSVATEGVPGGLGPCLNELLPWKTS